MADSNTATLTDAVATQAIATVSKSTQRAGERGVTAAHTPVSP